MSLTADGFDLSVRKITSSLTLLNFIGQPQEVLEAVARTVKNRQMIAAVGVHADDGSVHIVAIEIKGARTAWQVPVDEIHNQMRSDYSYLHFVQPIGDGTFLANGQDVLELISNIGLFVRGFGEIVFGSRYRSSGVAYVQDTLLLIGRHDTPRRTFVTDGQRTMFLLGEGEHSRVTTLGTFFLEGSYGGYQVRYRDNGQIVREFETNQTSRTHEAFDLPGCLLDMSLGIPTAKGYVLFVTVARGRETVVYPVKVICAFNALPTFNLDVRAGVRLEEGQAILRVARERVLFLSRWDMSGVLPGAGTSDQQKVAVIPMEEIPIDLQKMIGTYAQF